MAKSKKITPEFMLDNPDDTFVFLMPLNLQPDHENLANSHFEVAVQNKTKKDYFTINMSPEIFFTHFQFHRAYRNGKIVKEAKQRMTTYKTVYETGLRLNTRLTREFYDAGLGKYLDKDAIGQLLGWTYKYTDKAEKLKCYFIETENGGYIIPHYAIAIYYYYRSSTLREAVLKYNLDDLHLGYECDRDHASIVIPNYVPEADTPFIHRFLCQKDAIDSFNATAGSLYQYLKLGKEKYKNKQIRSVPINAKFPVRDEILIKTRVSLLEVDKKRYFYVHEILDDNSDIGFSDFTVYTQGARIKTDVDDLENLPVVHREDPFQTSERLKSENASKRFKQLTVTSRRRKACSSLRDVNMRNAKITDEEAIQLLKIYEETFTDEEVDQSLTDSSATGDKKTRKTRVSCKGQELLSKTGPEYTHNFDEFNQYMDYMRTQKMVENLCVYDVQTMEKVIKDKEGKVNPKCMAFGRERQYITATFKYKALYAGLLELENMASTSTWVIVSKSVISSSTFKRFIEHHVDGDEAVNDIKRKYQKDKSTRFKTKNHERSATLTNDNKVRWLAGLLGKVSI